MKLQELLEKYSEPVDITSKEFEELLYSLKLVSDDSKKNAQILCHGAGPKGVKNLHNILNSSGLNIIRKDPDSNNYVPEGLLSTNVCFNSPIFNDVDVEPAFGYKYHSYDSNGNFCTIVSAVPLVIGDIPLGRVIQLSKYKNCVLDDLGIENLPKEFILGVLVNDGKSQVSKFTLNPNFFMLSKENYNNAYDAIKQIFKNSTYGNVEEYYSHITSRMKSISQRKKLGMSIPEVLYIEEYQKEALSLYLKIRGRENVLDKKETNLPKKLK